MSGLIPYFIVNPVAGAKRGAERWKEFYRECLRRHLKVEAGMTEWKGHAMMLAHNAVQAGFNCVVAFGGDGTLNEALNGMLSNGTPSSSLCLGLVGAGSSNDFLRSFRPGNGEFLDHLIAEQTWTIDVGRIDCRDEWGAPLTRYFLVNASIGLVPRALEYFNRQTRANRMMKKISIDLAVIASGLNAIACHENEKYELTEDGRTLFSGTLANLAILKGPCFGGGMSYGQDAQAVSGELLAVGIGAMNRSERLTTMLRFYRGTILEHPKVWQRREKSFVVTSSSGGLVEADGELVGFLPARFSLYPEMLRVIT